MKLRVSWAMFVFFVLLIAVAVLSTFAMGREEGALQGGSMATGEQPTEVEQVPRSPQSSTIASPDPPFETPPGGELTTIAPTSVLPEGCEVPTGPSAPVHLEPDGVDLSKAAVGNPSAENVLNLPLENGAHPVPSFSETDRFAWSNGSGKLANSDGLNSIITTHTYSAVDYPLGNQMLAELEEGGLIRATNELGETLCYEVVERLVVPEGSKILNERKGQGMMIIIVCSDYKNGKWTTRTLWFGKLLK